MIHEALSDAKIHIQENSSNREEAWLVIKGIDSALTSLDAPFDPEKVEGWRRMGTYDMGGYLMSGWECGNFQLHKSSGLPWYDLTQLGTRMFRGEIKTNSFFLALCEALNIEQK